MDSISSETEIASSSSSSLSSSTPRWKYDVFLSFRGEETRHGFTDHLYEALRRKSIHVFRDDENLQRGEVIALELMEVIEKSQYAIIVLSEKYAESKWCLDELTKIVECRKRTGLTLFPVFYHVNPSHVRNQTGPFAIALAKHEKDGKINVQKMHMWKDALREVGNISGWHLHQSSESTVIQKIVGSIHSELYGECSSVFKDLVGIESSEEEMMDLLNTRVDDVRFIGIWGIGGVGKTTLAEVIYCKISNQFDAKSFIYIGFVRETGNHYLVPLQEQLLSKIDKRKLNITSVGEGKLIIRQRLHRIKVLIVLDNVNEQCQLDALAGSRDWFGPGSIIIITSRDKQLLTTHEVDNMYEAKTLDNEKALELFSRKAFKKPYPEKDFINLSNVFLKYAQGLPLALEVFGSSLYKKERDVWKSFLKQLKKNPDRKIVERLEISYKGLDQNVQELFLDIAIFFKGMDQNRVADILGIPGYLANIDILKNKSLITILGKKLWMHDLLQEMGREIVRCEAPQEPGIRSRLWHHKDIFSVLKNNAGTKKIKGMMLTSPPHKETLNANAFSKMTRLELIKIYDVLLPQGLKDLSNELRMMEWHDYPLRSMPRSFRPNNLVELIMPHSNIEQLPEGFSNLEQLKLMDFSYSQNLIKTPEFFGFPNLETLIFQGCTRLYKVHPSMGTLRRLIFLNLKDCKRLKNLPCEIKLESLESFFLSGCSRLRKLSKIGENMTCLSKLYLDGTALEELPSSIKHLTGLTLLNLKDCKYLLSFPSTICNLTSLEILILSGCRVQQPKPLHLLGLSPTLSSIGATLTFKATISLLILYFLLLPHYYLNIFICATLVLWTYCFSNAHHPKLDPINLLLPKSLSGLSSLKSLDLSDSNLSDGALPDDLSYLSSLQSLNLSKNNFTSLPNSISQLSKLKVLCLDNCSKLQSLPYLPLSTKYVMARGCTSLENYSNKVVVWTSGETGFTFINCLSLLEDEEGEITEGFLLDSLLKDNRSKITKVSLPDIYFQPLWQRYMEDHIREIEEFYSVLQQIEIPEWFNHQNCGSFVSIPLHQYSISWTGIALCVCFEVHENLNVVFPVDWDAKYFHEFRLEVHGGPINCPLVYKVPRDKIHAGSFGLWLYISRARFQELLNERDWIRPVIETSSPNIKIKGCGARILYEQDVVQFVQNLSQQIFGSPEDLRLSREDFMKYHMGKPQSHEDKAESSQSNALIDPNPRLRRALTSLLSRFYEAHQARHHSYNYYFPQIAIPSSWFSYQNLESHIKMDWPPNLHDNPRWMGLAVYGLYTIDKRQDVSSYKRDPTVFFRIFSLSASGAVPLAPGIDFPLSKDGFMKSSQRILLIFYIPRKLFQLNRCSHIWASFGSDNQGVKVQMCGIRLIFEHDVEGYLQTLVQCMLEIPTAYRTFLYRNLLSQLAQIQNCNHERGPCSSFSSERRPQTLPKLLSSNEIVTEEGCASPEAYSNHGSRSSSTSPIFLGIPFENVQFESTMSISILESFFKAHLQDHYNIRGIFNHCFPQPEIPQWFHPQRNGPSVKIPLSPYLYNDPDWMGFALCTAFKFHKHPTAILRNLNSGLSHRFMCHLETNFGHISPLLDYTINESNVLISLCQRAFIWVSFIPRGMLSHHWSECSWVRFSFLSDSPDLSVLKCGVNLVYQQNMEYFIRTIVQCVISNVNFMHGIRGPFCEEDVYKNMLLYHDDEMSGSDSSYEILHPQRIPNSQVGTSRSTQGDKRYGYFTGPLDFNPFTSYNICFPPSKILEEWFSHQSLGNSVTIDLPPNLYQDSNWMGLILYAFFSIQGDPEAVIKNFSSELIPHFLYSQFVTSTGDCTNVQNCNTSRMEITWLYNLGGFIWITYIPGEASVDAWRQLSHIEASFVSEWPSVIVKKCGYRLLYQHDQEQFQRKLKHCNCLLSDFLDSHYQFLAAQGKRNGRNPDNEVGHGRNVHSKRRVATVAPVIRLGYALEIVKKKTRLLKSDLLDFDGCSICNSCCPPREILDWFNHSDESSVAINIPKNDWMGLVLCAYFSVHEDQTNIFQIPNSTISHNLICLFETDVAGLEQELHIHSTNIEEFMFLEIEGGFLWLSYIPRCWFPDWLNQCSRLKASIMSDWPGLMVQKCGLRFFHVHDEEEFEQIIYRCHLASENGVLTSQLLLLPDNSRAENPLGENGQHPYNQPCHSNLTDLIKRIVYNFRRPLREILDWFSHQSYEPQVTIPLPPHLYNDTSWTGLAFGVSFEVDAIGAALLDIEDSETSYNLIGHLEASLECVESLHVASLTKEKLKMMKQGGTNFLSWIPRESFQDTLNQCGWIEASFAIDCLGFTVRKCGLCLLYQHNEEEFKEILKRTQVLFPE